MPIKGANDKWQRAAVGKIFCICLLVRAHQIIDFFYIFQSSTLPDPKLFPTSFARQKVSRSFHTFLMANPIF